MTLLAPPRPLEHQIDDGVIEEARRRQRRRRFALTGATLVAVFVALGAFLAARGGGTTPHASPPTRPPEPLPRLAGPALTGRTHLQIVAAGNWGSPFIFDVDRGSIRVLPGLGRPLAAVPGGALTEASRQTCAGCAFSETFYVVGLGGAARRVAALATRGGDNTVAAASAAAVWVLAWPHRGPCTLRLVPGTRPPVRVPCGGLAAATSAGVWIATARHWAIVDPLSGRIVAQLGVTPSANPAFLPGDQLFALHGDLALENSGPQVGGLSGTQAGTLRLVNLISGHRRRLAWPSYFGDIIRVVPEPHGPLVAVDFGSPAYPGPAQAEDIWMLDTTTATFTHLPEYPAQVDIKFSSVRWTSDDRLVIVAQGGGRTVLGVWKPGQATLPLRGLPNRASGYYSSVPLVG